MKSAHDKKRLVSSNRLYTSLDLDGDLPQKFAHIVVNPSRTQ
jgi:hypothetical protein